MMSGRAVAVRTPAKINLALVVGPIRPDGFHDLGCVYQAVGLYDEIVAEPAPGGEFTVTVSGPGADDVPLGRANLAVQAARLLADQSGADEGVRLHIRKGIPIAGGMAGGSSDAAATLVACDALWETKLDRSDLLAVAARIGSDVPFCVLGGTAIGTGHGELVTPAVVRGDYHWVLAFDSNGLSTPAVYAGLDERRAAQGPSGQGFSGGSRDMEPATGAPRVPEALLTALRVGDLVGVGHAIVNDLHDVALDMRPALRRVIDQGRSGGALAAIVSGSGPTCAFLARDLDHATELAARLSLSGLTSGVATASGPVPGARVI